MERVKRMTHDVEQVVNTLTERISQYLDSAKELTDINMGSRAGRQIVAAVIARQLIYDTCTSAVEAERVFFSNIP
jgi:hypothetical protein